MWPAPASAPRRWSWASSPSIPLIVLAGTALGYLCAWTGHFLVEKNRPAMVSHPAWAFQCDIRMFRLWLTGQLGPELKRAGVA